MNDFYIDMFGILSNIFYTSSLLPQIYKILVTKSATDLSYTSIFIGNTSELLWFSYAYIRDDFSLMLSSCGHFIIVTTLLFVKCYYDKKKKESEVHI